MFKPLLPVVPGPPDGAMLGKFMAGCLTVSAMGHIAVTTDKLVLQSLAGVGKTPATVMLTCEPQASKPPLAKQVGQKRQQGSTPVVHAQPKKQKTVYNEFSSSTGGSSSSDHSDPKPGMLAHLIVPKVTVKQTARRKAPLQKENQPVNKVRKQPARNAASTYATRTSAPKVRAPPRKQAANAHARGPPVPAQATAATQPLSATQPPATGRASTNTRKQPSQSGVQHTPAIPHTHMHAKQQQLPGKQPTGHPGSAHAPSRLQPAAVMQPARTSVKAFDDLLTAMLSQDDAAEPLTASAKPASYQHDMNAGVSMLGKGQLSKAGIAATHAADTSKKHTSSPDVQAAGQQRLTTRLFSADTQASLTHL